MYIYQFLIIATYLNFKKICIHIFIHIHLKLISFTLQEVLNQHRLSLRSNRGITTLVKTPATI